MGGSTGSRLWHGSAAGLRCAQPSTNCSNGLQQAQRSSAAAARRWPPMHPPAASAPSRVQQRYDALSSSSCPPTCSSDLSLTPRASAWKQRAARSQLPLLRAEANEQHGRPQVVARPNASRHCTRRSALCRPRGAPARRQIAAVAAACLMLSAISAGGVSPCSASASRTPSCRGKGAQVAGGRKGLRGCMHLAALQGRRACRVPGTLHAAGQAVWPDKKTALKASCSRVWQEPHLGAHGCKEARNLVMEPGGQACRTNRGAHGWCAEQRGSLNGLLPSHQVVKHKRRFSRPGRRLAGMLPTQLQCAHSTGRASSHKG